MSFVFLNAILWPLAALAAVPLLLHLFARSKPPVYRFSSVEFILRIVRTTLRVKRPQDWLLLLLRTALVVTLVLLFLRPLYFASRALAGPLGRKNVVVIVDATGSMGCNEGGRTRFATACAEASEVLAGLTSADRANVVWLDAEPDAVFPEMGVNMGYLRAALSRAELRPQTGDIAGALRLAVSMLENQDGRREICLVSDFQRAAWEKASLAVPDSIRLVNLCVAQGDGENGALTDLVVDPPAPLKGEEVTIHAEVANYSARPRQQTVFLELGEGRYNQDLMIPPWEKAGVSFRHRFRQPGIHTATVSLNEDRFTADDRRWAVIQVADSLSVGVSGTNTAEGRFWLRALGALSWVSAEPIDPARLPKEAAYDAVFLADGNGADADRFADMLGRGCAMVCVPSRGTPVGPLLAAAGVDASRVPAEAAWEILSGPTAARVARKEDRLFQLFAGGEYGDPAGGVFRARWRLPGDAAAAGETLIAYEDGLPALVRYRHGGLLYLWALPLDPEVSDWAARVEFVPFLGELLLSSRSARGGGATAAMPGDRLAWRVDREILASDVTLQHGAGEALPVLAQREAEGTRVVSESAADTGVYTWKYEGEAQQVTAVNFPALESDLRPIPVKEIEQQGRVALAAGRRARELRDGLPLWPYLLLAVVGWALLEGGVQVWAERT
ncbi:MAG TPA: VWA domain-containing protein [Kiritimatiellia bacterium]|nr:VWA domain-containing protein [Kiritimatiellia bacterium]HRZ12889.1 VWA domain-containing protein [Kiritimatiellia bacterium]HSA18501.1 VWA domain-containing protein [Kiritimatiellia bacterium]